MLEPWRRLSAREAVELDREPPEAGQRIPTRPDPARSLRPPTLARPSGTRPRGRESSALRPAGAPETHPKLYLPAP